MRNSKTWIFQNHGYFKITDNSKTWIIQKHEKFKNMDNSNIRSVLYLLVVSLIQVNVKILIIYLSTPIIQKQDRPHTANMNFTHLVTTV